MPVMRAGDRIMNIIERLNSEFPDHTWGITEEKKPVFTRNGEPTSVLYYAPGCMAVREVEKHHGMKDAYCDFEEAAMGAIRQLMQLEKGEV